MPETLMEIVKAHRSKGIEIEDEEAEIVHQLCQRKMIVGKIADKEEYLPILFEDELKNYIFRRVVNMATLVGYITKEA